MDATCSGTSSKRPWLITLLAIVAALAVLKDLIDLIGKPATLQHANHDVQVWFGYRFEGTLAKILTLPHLLIYGYGAYGLFRMRKLAWWVAFIYLLYLPICFVLYMLRYATGEAWEMIFTVVSLLLIVVLEVYLVRNRQRFSTP